MLCLLDIVADIVDKVDEQQSIDDKLQSLFHVKRLPPRPLYAHTPNPLNPTSESLALGNFGIVKCA